ncbi:DUF2312 domain-containing protein [Breoghania sp. L-A4]|uniref:DUF2312 domain-containing protein n=1 Tax=Breoghania sp. L-A4 TaxID=2304600 RepID=UPI000E359523|nr:DUF2312 domain-containing protein [Breoghania sp. L-A4]
MDSNSGGQAAELLRSFRDRIVRLEEEKKAISDDIKEVYKEAAGTGFDRKALRAIVKESMESDADREARLEVEAVTDLYLAALGMLGGTPLGAAARKRMSGGEPEATHDRPDNMAPDIDEDGAMSPDAVEDARERGRQGARDRRKITDNPYTADDPRRAAWDEGWCQESGSDGMDIPDAWKRRKPKKRRPFGDNGEAPE